MAHEIKNPLTPIRLAAERMRRRAAAAGDRELHQVVEEGASTIIDEVSTLSGLVDSFGRFARLPAARLEPADLGGVVLQVAKLYGAMKPGVTVTAEVPPDLPAVRADAEQVKRLLVNLVDNAVAATPAGGAVSIRATVDGGRAVALRDGRRPRHPARGPRTRLRPELLDEGARDGARALDRRADRRGARGARHPGGECAARMPFRLRVARRVRR